MRDQEQCKNCMKIFARDTVKDGICMNCITEHGPPTYVVYRVFRNDEPKRIIAEGLTRDEAMKEAQNYESDDTQMVCFDMEDY